MMAQLPLMQKAPNEAQADQQKEGPVMALMSWERHAQELMYCQDDAESASGWQCAEPEWQESAPDFNHSKRLSQLQFTKFQD